MHLRSTAICSGGHGMLSNEIYIGRIVWNKVRMVKDPMTGTRRINIASLKRRTFE